MTSVYPLAVWSETGWLSRRTARERDPSPTPVWSETAGCAASASAPLFPAAPQIDHQQSRTNRDRAVGHIERRKFVRAEKQLQEIRHRSAEQPVHKVPERSPEH